MLTNAVLSRLPEIAEALVQIEQENEARILYACESGSRAWGFASPNSDYDVRFIYVHPADVYVSINERRDVIELPVDAVLDVSGWDLKKALWLLYKSNVALSEWLQSPIVYANRNGFADSLLALAHQYFSPRVMAHHYLSMAYNALSELDGTSVRLKKYFYALRPLLAAQWIVEREELPPMEFHSLRVLLPERLSETIGHLLMQKMIADEKAMILPVAELNDYIQITLDICTSVTKKFPKHKPDIDPLNDFFRAIVRGQS